MKASRLLILTAVAAVAFGAPALAFHDGGVAHCNGCHTMHNSQNNQAMNYDSTGALGGTEPGFGYTDLLLYENKTDICLRCHARETSSYGVWSASPTAPVANHANRGGGDFVFLEEDNINDGHGAAIPGYQAGHNVISGIKGTVRDPMNLSSPGGDYSSANMACSSCHDPHGTSSFRILYQDGQSVDGTLFTATLVAEGISLSDTEGNANHNAYHEGYSDWCGTCHGDFHANSGNLIHPSGEPLGGEVATTYNKYNGTTDCIANPPAMGLPCGTGSQLTSYLAAVPFEDPAVTTTSTEGPTGSSRVACMTCHRAHATSGPDAGRWDFNVTGLAEDGHETGSYPIPNPYDTNQRSLCNKCHSQDEFDLLVNFTPVP